MSHNDSPHNIISNAVVTMNHIVARINYSSGCCNFYLGANLSNLFIASPIIVMLRSTARRKHKSDR